MQTILNKIRLSMLVISLVLFSSHVFAIGELSELASLNVNASVPPYTSVDVSTTELTFEILGTPGVYVSTDVVTLTIASNQSAWGVYAQSSDLIHKDIGVVPLPAKRLSFSVNDDPFKPLTNKVLFMTGTTDKQVEPVKLRFQLQTTWKDTPGVYRGKVTIAFFNNP